MNYPYLKSLLFVLVSAVLIGKTGSSSVSALINAYSAEAGTERHITPYLLDIAKNGHSFSETDKEQLKRLGFNFKRNLVTRTLDTRPEASGLDQFLDQGIFRIHFTTQGDSAVNDVDLDFNNYPDYVDQVAGILDTVSNVMINQMAYTPPPRDDWNASGTDNGEPQYYDVYLTRLRSNWYGAVYPDEYAQGTGDNEQSIETEKNAFTSYMALRNNYNGFPHDEIDALRVTVAHEFFHSIQFGIDGWQEPWLLEATATWMEEALYDHINDCYQYMPKWFESPETALDAAGIHWYGSYIFFEYIDEHLGGSNVIKEIFDFSLEKNSRSSNSSIWSINQALLKNNFSFNEALNNMVIANQIMSSLADPAIYSYEEAHFYNVAPAVMDTINFQAGFQQTTSSSDLEQYASQYIKVFTAAPIQIDFTNLSSEKDQLKMHTIIKLMDNSYKIYSAPSINIDPVNIKSINLAVVSQDSIQNNWNYEITFKDGKPGTISLGPDEFLLNDPYPNPFNKRLNLLIYMYADNNLKVEVIDLKGRRIALIWDGSLAAGNHVLNWNGKFENGKAAASGIYYLVFKGKNTQLWKPVTLLK